MNIVIRVNATRASGTGHFYRTLNLAKSLKSNKTKVFFICDKLNKILIKKLKIEKINYYVLKKKNIEKNYQQKDILQTARVLRKIGGEIDLMIIDSYQIGKYWEDRIRKYVKKIMVIDDLADRLHDCNLLIDHGIFPNSEERYKDLAPKNCKKLLGAKYALLDPEYANFRKKTLPRKNFNNLSFFCFWFS